jgi:predicted ATP-grasp superfamily ATP-dependent carboligase
VEATEEMPDPAAAAEVVRVLGDVRGVSTDVRPLVEQAKTIQKQLQVLATHTERVKQQDMKNSPVPIYT